MVVDAHHHFWNYTAHDYGWIDESMSALRRDFAPAELKRELATAGVEGVVSVQARQSLAETEWLLALAAEHDFVRGVVGWVPLADPEIDRHLERLASNRQLKGVRHVVQDEPDDSYMLRADFKRGLRHLRRYGLVYDLLIFPRHLATASTLADEFYDQSFVLDHVAKPHLRTGELHAWATELAELARRPNVTCKLSGLVTEANLTAWTESQMADCFEIALEAFGPRRLLFGTDWPVCLLATTYATWTSLVRRFVARLTAAERAGIMGENAIRIYGLSRSLS